MAFSRCAEFAGLAARKYISQMRLGDTVLFYHSQQELAVVGVMEVTREAYPDPMSADPQWLTCDFAPVKTLAHPVSLATIKADSRFANLGLVRQPRGWPNASHRRTVPHHTRLGIRKNKRVMSN